MKQTNNGLAALDEKDPNMPKIEEIILKYQWPMSAACALDPDAVKQKMFAETDDLFIAGVPNAEELFIEKEIQKIDKNYRVIFFPTTLYELFVMKQAMIDIPLDTPLIRAINNLNSNEKDTMDMRPLLNNNDPNTVRTNVKNYHAQYNQYFLGKPDSAYAYINRLLGAWVLKQIPKIIGKPTLKPPSSEKEKMLVLALQPDSQDIAEIIKENAITLAATLLTQVKSESESDEFNNIEGTPLKIGRTNKIKPLLDYASKDQSSRKSESIISKYISLEYDARELNYALIVRGTRFLGFNTKNNDPFTPGYEVSLSTTILADSTIDMPGKKVLTDKYINNTFTPYTLFFGNSLFAGIFRKLDVCVYTSLKESDFYNYKYAKEIGYVLDIDKSLYITNFNNQLFFIPPFASILGIFVWGDFFHPRSKAAIAHFSEKVTINDIITRALSPSELRVSDPTQLLIIVQNPLEHAAIFSDFVSKNINIIQPEYTQGAFQKKVERAQKDAAEYFRNIIAEAKSTVSPESFGLRALRDKQEEIARQQLKEAKRKLGQS